MEVVSARRDRVFLPSFLRVLSFRRAPVRPLPQECVCSCAAAARRVSANREGEGELQAQASAEVSFCGHKCRQHMLTVRARGQPERLPTSSQLCLLSKLGFCSSLRPDRGLDTCRQPQPWSCRVWSRVLAGISSGRSGCDDDYRARYITCQALTGCNAQVTRSLYDHSTLTPEPVHATFCFTSL